MSLFKYVALNQKGKKVTGVFNADSIMEAKKSLTMQQVIVTHLSQYVSNHRLTLSRTEVLEFIRDLSNLLNASLNLYDALKAISDKTRQEKAGTVFADLCDKVRQGERFSSALKAYPKIFSKVVLAIIEAGEESGALAESLKELFRMMSVEDRVRKNLSSALIYPIFLSVFCAVVIIGLFVFLIPSMKDLFEGRSLPPFTAAVFHISDWLSQNIFSLLFALIAIFGLIFSYFRFGKGKIHWQHIELKIPIIGTIKKEASLVKFSRTFSVLLSSSVPALRALEMATKVMNQVKLEEIMEEGHLKLTQGKKLSEVLDKYALIPPLFVKMIATAEQTATLDTMLSSLADLYQADLEKHLQQFTSLIQPVMILLLGLIVGLVLLSVLLPMTDVSAFIS